ncbi:hypothetical protein ACQ4PT_051614 [Festuca glaucescens]
MRGGGLLFLALALAFAACGVAGHGVHPLSRIAVHRARVALDASAAVRASPKLLGSRPTLVAVSNKIAFANPKAPVYPRLALGKTWNEMTVTWTSGYDTSEASPIVEWGLKGSPPVRTTADTATFGRERLCGEPASTVGRRDPGFIHTAFLKNLRPDKEYYYKLKLGTRCIMEKLYGASLNLSQQPLHRDKGRCSGLLFSAERNGSNEYQNFQPASLNTTDAVMRDLDNTDIVFHIGDISYANGYLSQWDQFTQQVEPITSRVPYMLASTYASPPCSIQGRSRSIISEPIHAQLNNPVSLTKQLCFSDDGSGNHERDFPNSGSFYNGTDSGGECGVPAATMYYVPAENRANYWYMADYGMFRFCVADSEQDWREGTEQYSFIEHCLATVDRAKQPWLIFTAHRVLGYSSGFYYSFNGAFREPMGRQSLEPLWRRYRVDVAFYGHFHQYERTCPVHQEKCVQEGTVHIVVGGAGAYMSNFTTVAPPWSVYRDMDYDFGKLTASNETTLQFECGRSSDGQVYDSFTVHKDKKNV